MMTQVINGTKLKCTSLDRKIYNILWGCGRAYLWMHEYEIKQSTINIGTGQAFTITEIIKTIAKVVNKPFEKLSLKLREQLEIH